jgi:hypothetical protein
VLQEFKLENLTVGEREVGCSPVIREFEFVFLTVGNPYRNGRRERISSSEAMIYQWASLGLCLMVKNDNVPRPYISISAKRQHHINCRKKHLSFIIFGRADPAQAVPKKPTLPINLATVNAVFVCIFVKCRCYSYMDETFICLQRGYSIRYYK